MLATAVWVGGFVEALCCGVVSYHRVGRVGDFKYLDLQLWRLRFELAALGSDPVKKD